MILLPPKAPGIKAHALHLASKNPGACSCHLRLSLGTYFATFPHLITSKLKPQGVSEFRPSSYATPQPWLTRIPDLGLRAITFPQRILFSAPPLQLLSKCAYSTGSVSCLQRPKGLLGAENIARLVGRVLAGPCTQPWHSPPELHKMVNSGKYQVICSYIVSARLAWDRLKPIKKKRKIL